MADNFTSLWHLAFSWLGLLLHMPLPIYFGSTALCMLDIIIGTAGVLVAIAAVRALLKSGFSIAGKELIDYSVERYNKSKIMARARRFYNDTSSKPTDSNQSVAVVNYSNAYHHKGRH